MACELADAGQDVVVDVPDAETLALEDGRQVRLADVISPRRPLWLADDLAWDRAREAQQALILMAEGHAVRLATGKPARDRYGRLLAHVFVNASDGSPDLWLQSALVADGHWRVTTTLDDGACAVELLAVEAAARTGGRGVWADPHYRVREAGEVDEIARLLNHFHLVEGRVHQASERGSRIYLNFAEDWRSDFTVIVARRDVRRFEAAGIDLLAMAGQRVRVRGFVRNFNGPAIDAAHPGQIEVLAGE